MVKLNFLIICSLITLISFLNVNNNNEDKELYFTQLALENIEALANNESGTDHYWCCGNTSTCVKGPDYEIKGKFKDNPC